MFDIVVGLGKRHWLLLVAAAAIVVAVIIASTAPAEASHGGFYFEGWRNWDGSWCVGLFSGTSHSLLQVVYCY